MAEVVVVDAPWWCHRRENRRSCLVDGTMVVACVAVGYLIPICIVNYQDSLNNLHLFC